MKPLLQYLHQAKKSKYLLLNIKKVNFKRMIVDKNIVKIIQNNIYKIERKNMSNDQFRNTGKFKAYQQMMISQNYFTNSTIKIPSALANGRLKKIFWARRCGEFNQKLPHLDDCLEYACSELDKDCIIEANVELENFNGQISHKPFVFGPIKLSNQFIFLTEDINNQNQVFDVEIVGQKKSYNCILTIQTNQMIIKSKLQQFNHQHIISLPDIMNSYVKKVKNMTVLVVPTLFRVIPLKLFRQIISQVNYSEQYDPIMIRVVQPNDPKLGQSKLTTNILYHNAANKWRRFLLKINSIKHDAFNRISANLSTPPVTNKVVTRSTQQYPRYSQDIANYPKIEEKTKDKESSSLKKSQTFNRNIHSNKKEKHQELTNQLASSQKNYLFQFEDILGGEQPEAQALALNQSFEQMNKKRNTQQEKKIKQQIKIKRRQRQAQNKVANLKARLKQVLEIKQTLLNQLQKQKKQVQRLERQKRQSSRSNNNVIESLRQHLSKLKATYDQCYEEQRVRRQEQRKSIASS